MNFSFWSTLCSVSIFVSTWPQEDFPSIKNVEELVNFCLKRHFVGFRSHGNMTPARNIDRIHSWHMRLMFSNSTLSQRRSQQSTSRKHLNKKGGLDQFDLRRKIFATQRPGRRLWKPPLQRRQPSYFTEINDNGPLMLLRATELHHSVHSPNLHPMPVTSLQTWHLNY